MPISLRLAAQAHSVSLPDRRKALDWYELARKDSVDRPDILVDVERQIQMVSNAPAGIVTPLRNPAKE